MDVVAYDDGTALPSSSFGGMAAMRTTAAQRRLARTSAWSRTGQQQGVRLESMDATLQRAILTARCCSWHRRQDAQQRVGSMPTEETYSFAGEGRGGAHADEEFFATLERFFTLVRTEPLQPFPGGCEKLWILQRKQSLRNVPSASLPSIS